MEIRAPERVYHESVAAGPGKETPEEMFKARSWKLTRVLFIAVATGLALMAAGFLFAWSGVYNVGASAGHWAVTRWLLHFSMRQSVETHSIGLKAPVLDDLALIEQGAGHFHTGCAPCHGPVEGAPPAIPQRMTPHPPLLPPVIDEWTEEELF